MTDRAAEYQTSLRSNKPDVGGATYYLAPMQIDDIAEVSAVEHRCFTNPWPESAYRRELRNSANNYYVVLRLERAPEINGERQPESRGRLPLFSLGRRWEQPGLEPVVGFTGMWTLYDEAHVTTIGVAPEHRGLGLGEVLLTHLFEEAIRRDAQWVTLEVRVSNDPAIRLYEKFGFTIQGVRRRYYSDNGEDAHIMWSPSLRDTRFRDHLDELRERLRGRLSTQSVAIRTRDR